MVEASSPHIEELARSVQFSCKLAEMEAAILSLVLLSTVQASILPPTYFKHTGDWEMWKTQHGKSYGSVREELERHLVWLANREYINAHNQNSHIFGFTLTMNHLGDMVSLYLTPGFFF